MIMLGGAAMKIHLATGPTDLRRGYAGLDTLIEHEFGVEPRSGRMGVHEQTPRSAQGVLMGRRRDGRPAQRLHEGTKRDPRGRLVVTAEERTTLLEAYRRSGRTQRAFAQREGIKYSTFTAWLQGRRRAEAGARPAAAKPKFTELRLPNVGPEPRVEVRLPDGTVVRGTRVPEVVELLRALKA